LSRAKLAFIMLCILIPVKVSAQTDLNMAVLNGLAPVSVLPNSQMGQAALAGNLAITGGIQTGAIKQATLLPFPEQQQLALRDAFITGGNACELADAFGTRLGEAYQSLAHYDDWKRFTSISQSITDLITYTDGVTRSDSGMAKYFFANLTTDGKTPISQKATAILDKNGGVADVFGKAYNRRAGSEGADAFGNSRPFQTEPSLTPINGPDYFGTATDNIAYLRGPLQNLVNNPSYPSGHTTYGYMEAVLLGILIPERYQQEVTRAAEYGNDRVIIGAHYAMDVLGGRTLSLHDLAHLLANDPAYVGSTANSSVSIKDYQAAIRAARADLVAALEKKCGLTISACAADDTSRFRNKAANEALYNETQTYGLPVVYPEIAAITEDVAKIAPEAGYLLTAAFPYLTLEQANTILTETEGPGGGFLNNGSAFGLYSRLNLYAAIERAVALKPKN